MTIPEFNRPADPAERLKQRKTEHLARLNAALAKDAFFSTLISGQDPENQDLVLAPLLPTQAELKWDVASRRPKTFYYHLKESFSLQFEGQEFSVGQVLLRTELGDDEDSHSIFLDFIPAQVPQSATEAVPLLHILFGADHTFRASVAYTALKSGGQQWAIEPIEDLYDSAENDAAHNAAILEELLAACAAGPSWHLLPEIVN